MAQMERSVHAIEQAVTLLTENHGQLHLPPVRAHRACVPPRRYSPSQMFGNQRCTPQSQDILFPLVQREGSNVETQENDPDYVPSQRSTSADNINTLEPTSAFSIPHWNFCPHRGDEPTQANLEDKIMLTNRKAQLSRTQDSLRERNETLQKDMETLRQQMEELRMAQQQATDAPQIASIGDPFSDEIIKELMPPSFKPPQLTQYDGKQDPIEHVRSYKLAMMIYGVSDALLCKVFPYTLKKATQTYKVPKKTNHHLMSIRQKTDESLRAYIARFHNQSLQVDNLDEGMAMHALMNGLKDCNFLHSLNKEKPKSLKDILHRSEGYIRAEERVIAKKGVLPSATPISMALAIKGSNESQPSTQTITFTGKDLDQREVFLHDPLMIEIVVEDRNLQKGKVMKRVLVDTRSCRDVMCYGAFKKLGVSPQLMRPCDFPLVGLFRKSMPIRGIISLPIHIGVSPCVAVVTLDLFVIDVPSSFNAILGRPRLNSLEAMVSTQVMMIKFPTPNGVGMARRKPVEVVERTPQAQDQVQTSKPNKVTKKKYKSKHWDLVALGDIVREKTLIVNSLDMREELKECRTEPIDQVKHVVLDEKRPEHIVNIGVDMDPSFMVQLENCLREHKDIFAWCPTDMPGINPKVACHRLGVNPDAVPVRQKVRHFEAERTVAIEEKVAKLKEARFIQEITFSEWLSNVGYELSQVRRSENLKADALAKLASTGLDNGTKFASEAFKDFCETGKIKRRFSVRAQLETKGLSLQQIEQRFASVAYLESNGQAKAANKAILESLKKKRTTHKTPTGETPFNLTYGSEAVVPVEVKVPNYRTNYFNANSNEQALRENLDLLDKARDLCQIHVAHYHRRVEKYYNSKVRPKDLHQGDWVL
ncbi:hypothetical protein SLEP1_g11805 [Rubroshorea leprosula]|nr:hypothetical protein SLEP1_g11805 [Rubroshorea leprosula]